MEENKEESIRNYLNFHTISQRILHLDIDIDGDTVYDTIYDIQEAIFGMGGDIYSNHTKQIEQVGDGNTLVLILFVYNDNTYSIAISNWIHLGVNISIRFEDKGNKFEKKEIN